MHPIKLSPYPTAYFEIEQLNKCEAGLAGRLSNEGFLSKAPQDVVAKDKERLAEMRDKIKKLEETIKNFTK